MTLLRVATHATLTFFLAATLIPQALWADINVSPNSLSITESSNINTTLGNLATGSSASATTNNLSLLQAQISSLNTQITNGQSTLSNLPSSNSNYPRLQSEIAQMQATSNALQGIVTRLKEGSTITGYTTSTDASTQATTATITFSKPNNGGSSTLTAYIPPLASNDDSTSSSSDDTSEASESTDMLTQLLQQIGSQLAGGQNPFSSIQSTLNNIAAGSGIPLTPEALKNAIANNLGQSCATDGKGAGNGVAVYDIAAGKVYMPDGSVLEAHSGMGAMMDNPAYANQRMNGPTPPNTYNLTMRESPYYGVAAIRMTPTDPSSMYGRDGILAHSKLVRGNNGSHGCVAFADYGKFLAAFQAGQVKQLIVVPSTAGANNTCTAADVSTSSPKSLAR